MKKISAEILADSKDGRGNRITSFLLTYPRIIHSELMTHRMFSRNSASSRAIPFERMVKMVETDPFVPIAWQKTHKGMQGTKYIDDPVEIKVNEKLWELGLRNALNVAKTLNNGHVTKQLCNRLLEPFMWHTVLVTATEYDNFFDLRCPKYKMDGEYYRSVHDLKWDFYTYSPRYSSIMDYLNKNESQAEIHIQKLAETMWDTLKKSEPKTLFAGEWHMPFGDKMVPQMDMDSYTYEKLQLKVATARCARTSYMTFDNDIDWQRDIDLHDMLKKHKHMSPFEHCARCMTEAEYNSFVKGYNAPDAITLSAESRGWCNNFKGFIPYRYLVENNYN